MVSGRKDRETRQEIFLLYPPLALRYSLGTLLGDDIIMFSWHVHRKEGLVNPWSGTFTVQPHLEKHWDSKGPAMAKIKDTSGSLEKYSNLFMELQSPNAVAIFLS